MQDFNSNCLRYLSDFEAGTVDYTAQPAEVLKVMCDTAFTPPPPPPPPPSLSLSLSLSLIRYASTWKKPVFMWILFAVRYGTDRAVTNPGDELPLQDPLQPGSRPLSLHRVLARSRYLPLLAVERSNRRGRGHTALFTLTGQDPLLVCDHMTSSSVGCHCL